MIGWSVIASRTVTFADGTKKEEKRKVTYKPKPRRVEVHPCKIPKGEPGATGEPPGDAVWPRELTAHNQKKSSNALLTGQLLHFLSQPPLKPLFSSSLLEACSQDDCRFNILDE